jgi:hypothetical protein
VPWIDFKALSNKKQKISFLEAKPNQNLDRLTITQKNSQRPQRESDIINPEEFKENPLVIPQEEQPRA